MFDDINFQDQEENSSGINDFTYSENDALNDAKWGYGYDDLAESDPLEYMRWL